MNKVNWTVVVVTVIIALLVLMFGASLLGGWRYSGWGMMGPWMMGGMFFMWLIPIGFLVLTILGVVWIVRAIGSGSNPAAPAHTCPACGRGVQTDWKNCPYCGEVLAK